MISDPLSFAIETCRPFAFIETRSIELFKHRHHGMTAKVRFEGAATRLYHVPVFSTAEKRRLLEAGVPVGMVGVSLAEAARLLR